MKKIIEGYRAEKLCNKIRAEEPEDIEPYVEYYKRNRYPEKTRYNEVRNGIDPCGDVGLNFVRDHHVPKFGRYCC